jgi:hypothetical protein
VNFRALSETRGMALLNLSGWARWAEPSPAHHYIQAKTLEFSRVFLKYKKDKEFIRY